MKPRTRGDCLAGPRPCPWTGCRYHLASDVRGPLSESCALDVAGRGGATLEEVGNLLGVSRERIRQIEGTALEKLRVGGGAQVARELLGEESGGPGGGELELLLRSAGG